MFIIAADKIRPFENLSGLVTILHRTGRRPTVVSQNPKLEKEIRDYVSSTSLGQFDFVRELRFRDLIKRERTIILGGQLDFGYGSAMNWLLNNFVFRVVYFPPGIVDKPLGQMKFKPTKLKKAKYIFRRMFIAITRRVYITSTLEEFAKHYAQNNFFPRKSLAKVDLPKHIAMKAMRQVTKKTGQSYKLYAPTHDQAGQNNQLLVELSERGNHDDRFRISIHPQDKEKYSVPADVLFDGDWSRVSNVYSDYSSLGLDFTHSTGIATCRSSPNNTDVFRAEIFGIPVHYVPFEDFLLAEDTVTKSVSTIEQDCELWEQEVFAR